tara:strand:- start:553 stop:816 length:264 start_codon:yes stop_codon:yes gene_type:complete
METHLTPITKKTRPQGTKSPTRREGDLMKIAAVLAKLEKHEAECTLRYQRIEETLGEQKLSMKALDIKIWALAVLIVVAPLVHKLWG